MKPIKVNRGYGRSAEGGCNSEAFSKIEFYSLFFRPVFCWVGNAVAGTGCVFRPSIALSSARVDKDVRACAGMSDAYSE